MASESVGISTTMAARVSHAIRNDIISGVLSPGVRLRVAELSTRYGVSHIPVREALRQLEGDRLVVIDPHKGAILRDVSAKFVADIHDTRAAIEVLLVRKATEKITDAEVAELGRLAAAYEEAAAAGRSADMVLANLTFHRFIARIADNPEAAEFHDRGWELVVSIRNRYGFGPGRIASVIDEHRRLVAAIRARDVGSAVAVTQEHCDAAKLDLLDRMAITTGQRPTVTAP
ncbi:GntR family transcriptional regulator [Xanthobacteraceae bacterium Astr-EGSB]|uniref:GntR family transcriptional regulator n=1 Tax=Astrobacterium formosum TaxID=3069710 RepID=UPI0027B5F459|nr:GntR family transcriptional regulator [Xanthobacteraceae bacterium Astr-EGSB]